MENLVFTIARRLADLESLYLTQLEEVIDCTVTRYKLLHHTECAIFSLKGVLRSYLCAYQLHFEPKQCKLIEKALSFPLFESRRSRESVLLDRQIERNQDNLHNYSSRFDLPF